VIVPELDNTFFSEVLAGAVEVADENNMTILISNTCNNAQRERDALSMMEQQRVKGVIFTPAVGYADAKEANEIRRKLRHLNVPVILVDREIENGQWDGVFYENFQSGYKAAQRLIERDCKTIGIIKGDMKLKHARERYKGYLQALEDYNIPFQEEYVYEGNYTVDRSYDITKAMIQSGRWPEGIVLTNNRTTLGYMKAMISCGWELDREIQMVCIDHIPSMDMLGFQYDCITRDTRKMGEIAVRLLLERLERPTMERKIHIVPCILQYNAVNKGESSFGAGKVPGQGAKKVQNGENKI